MKKWIPWITVAIFAGWVLSTLKPEPQPDFDLRGFSQLPVLMGGRIQPMDSVARNSLLEIRHKHAVFLPDETASTGMFPKGTNLTAIQWLANVMMKPEAADQQKFFRIDNLELVNLLKLPDKANHFSFEQLRPKLPELEKQAERIEVVDKIPPQNQTALERGIIRLHHSAILYMRLELVLRPIDSDNLTADIATAIKGVETLRSLKEPEKEADPKMLRQLEALVGGFEPMTRMAYVLTIPPQRADMARDNWTDMGTTLSNAVIHEAKLDPVAKHYTDMVTAFRQNKPAEFNQAVLEYQTWLNQWFAPEAKKGRSEYFFNHFEPFYLAMIIYVTAFLLACCFWFNWAEWLRRSAMYLVVLAFIIHTFGLIYRMALEGRPPVTNLYSSAIFIGWGAAILGMVLERIYKDGIGSVIAAAAGFLTLIIAHNLALSGDTMEMLVAVLDSNFWLSTHVTVVTLGYSSTFVAGFLAIIYIMRGFFTRTLDETTAKSLGRMVYGIVCFAALFSFVGTVLGGIWADQSWGRFWGWDPKENGALLIVLWNAVILHARWGGMIKERGLMNMALIGNIITSFSWFGVNMLGIGLHSYGFTDDSKFTWLMIFIGSQLALIAVGLMPKRWWRSFQKPQPAVVPPGGLSGGPKGKHVPAAA